VSENNNAATNSEGLYGLPVSQDAPRRMTQKELSWINKSYQPLNKQE